MATTRQGYDFLDKVNKIFAPSTATFGKTAVTMSPDLANAVNAFQLMVSRSGITGQIDDNELNRKMAEIKSLLGSQSSGLYDALQPNSGATTPMEVGVNNTIADAKNNLQQFTGIDSSQYAGTGGAVTPSVSSSAPDLTGANDKATIESEGQRQYQQSLDQISADSLARQTARQKLAESLTKQAQDSFGYSLPSTLEDLNARHLLNGSGLGQELARQQGQIATGITDQLGTLGAADITDASAARAAALQGMQGFQTSGLNREFSLQDFQRQAQLSRELGAMSSPSVGGGKGAVGSTLGGIGAVATPLAYMAGPGAGLAATAANGVVANTAFGPVTRKQTIQGGGGK